MNQDRKGVRGLVRWHWYHRNKSTCGNRSQTPFSLLPSTLLVFKQPITHLVKRWCGQSLSFRPECDMVQSFKIGEQDFGNFPPLNPVALRMIPNSRTCFLSTFNTSTPKIVRAKFARTLVLANLDSWVRP